MLMCIKYVDCVIVKKHVFLAKARLKLMIYNVESSAFDCNYLFSLLIYNIC